MKAFKCFLASALITAASLSHGQTSKPAVEEKAAPPPVVEMIPLASPEGQALLDEATAVDYKPLQDHWVEQLKSHCGAASAVIVQNALIPDAEFTQDSLFTPETAHIITQDVVYRIGFTLEELQNMIHTRSGLDVERFHAGPDEEQHGYDEWIAALKKNRESADDALIINYPVMWLYTRENAAGHFSPIADYNEAENKVLVLEISPKWETYWVDAKELWDAMNQVDKVSGRERGWLVIKKPEGDV